MKVEPPEAGGPSNMEAGEKGYWARSTGLRAGTERLRSAALPSHRGVSLSDWLPSPPEDARAASRLPDGPPPNAGVGSQHTLVLIDCGRSMTLAPAAGPTPFERALRGCERAVRQRVRDATANKTGKRDAFGVLLYNTRLRLAVGADTDPSAATSKAVSATDRASETDPMEVDSLDRDDDTDDEDEDYDEDYGKHGLSYKFLPTTVHEFIPLGVPGISTIQTLRRALERDDDDIESPRLNLQTLYGHPQQDGEVGETSGPDLNAALFTAGDALNRIRNKKNGDPAQIWVLTNDPDPCRIGTSVGGGDGPERVLQNTIYDQARENTWVVVWPVGSDPLETYASLGAKVQPPTAEADDDFLDLNLPQPPLWRTAHPTWRLPLIRPDWKDHCREDPDGAAATGEGERFAAPAGIQLDWYDLISRRTRPSEVPMHACTGRPLSSESHCLASGGGPILRIKAGSGRAADKVVFSIPRDRWVQYALLCRGVEVPMTDEDRAAILEGSTGCPHKSLVLLGFKPADEVPFYQSRDKTYFVCSSSSDDDGNGAVAFAHLRASMIRKQVVAVGELLTKSGVASRLVALRPFVPDGDVPLQPPSGLIATILPYQEEVRDANDDPSETSESTPVSDDLRSAMTSLVQRLTWKEEKPVIGEDFTNAHLERLYQYIECVALNEPYEEDEFDTVLSPEERLRRSTKCQNIVDRIKKSLPKHDHSTCMTPRKRSKEAAIDASSSDWTTLYLSCQGNLNKWTVPKLKEYCKEMGLMQAGKKADLVSRVEAHLRASNQGTIVSMFRSSS